MKKAIVVLLLVVSAFPASGQAIREGLDKIRREGLEIMLAVYRRPDVVDWCMKNPDSEMTVRTDGPSSEITISCKTRREFLALIEQRPPQ